MADVPKVAVVDEITGSSTPAEPTPHNPGHVGGGGAKLGEHHHYIHQETHAHHHFDLAPDDINSTAELDVAVANMTKAQSAYELERAKARSGLEAKRVAVAVEGATTGPDVSLGGAIAPPTLDALSLKQWSKKTEGKVDKVRLWQYFDFGNTGKDTQHTTKLNKIWKTKGYKAATVEGVKAWVSEHGNFGQDWFRGRPIWQLTRLDTFDNYNYHTVATFIAKNKQAANLYFATIPGKGDPEDDDYQDSMIVESNERFIHRALVMHFAELLSPMDSGPAPEEFQKLILKLGKTHQAEALKEAAALVFPGHEVEIIIDANGYKAPIIRDLCIVFDIHGYLQASTECGTWPPSEQALSESLSKTWARLLL